MVGASPPSCPIGCSLLDFLEFGRRNGFNSLGILQGANHRSFFPDHFLLNIKFHPSEIQFRCSLFDDFQHCVFFDFGRDGSENGPHGLGGATLLSDNLTDVFLGNTQFQHSGLVTFDRIDPNILGAVHEGLYNPGDQFIYLSRDGVHFPLSLNG
jgi:hypothetical protein